MYSSPNWYKLMHKYMLQARYVKEAEAQIDFVNHL